MVIAHINRILLIALLPIIALVLYFEGQSYDPALINFKSVQPAEDDTASFFPQDFEAFSKRGPLRVYTKDNLYEYINGHAEHFISSGFIRLVVCDYIETGSADKQPDAVVDIYDMGKSIHAFGVLADEAGNSPSYIQIGSMGISTSGGVAFIKGKYYIKIMSFSDRFPVVAFAERIDREIGPVSDDFSILQQFPDLGEVVSTRFIKEAYRGLDFVNNVLEREYMVDGESVQLFVVTGERTEIGKLAGDFIDYFRESDIKYSVSVEKERKIYRVEDPYEGDWVMISSPDTLFGIYGAFNDSMINTLLIERDK